MKNYGNDINFPGQPESSRKGVPPVTVLMTVYNGKPYLAQTIESILKQTYRDFVFLILDNNSYDGSREMVEAISDPRIHHVPLKENIGQTAALNCGLKMAESDWIARIDADDVAYPGRLERQMAYLEKHPETALLGTWYELIDSDGVFIQTSRKPVTHEELAETLAISNPFAHASVVFRRESALAVGGYPEDFVYAQDRVLWMKLSNKYKVANLPEVLTKVRWHKGQATQASELSEARKRDFIAYLKLSGSIGRISPETRKAWRVKMVKGLISYAEAMAAEGKKKEAFRYLVESCLRYPDVWMGKMNRKIRRIINGNDFRRQAKKT